MSLTWLLHVRSRWFLALTLLLVTLVCKAASVDASSMYGAWTLSERSEPGTATLTMTYYLDARRQGQWGRRVDLTQARGLRSDAFRTRGAVAFDIVRDAGTFHCTGAMAIGHGKGRFTFVTDPDFARNLERRGIGRPTADEQAELAIADAGYALIDGLEHASYPTPRVGQLVELAEHGVDAAFVRELAASGYRLGSLERLQTTRDHGVTAEYIQGLRDEGLEGLTYEQVVRARDHGVTAEYIHELRRAGYTSLSYDDIVEARDHGVSEEFLQGLSNAGFRGLAFDSVVRARDHGLDGRLAREARRELGPRATIEDAIEWRDRGGR